jgi:hypothetical protein
MCVYVHVCMHMCICVVCDCQPTATHSPLPTNGCWRWYLPVHVLLPQQMWRSPQHATKALLCAPAYTHHTGGSPAQTCWTTTTLLAACCLCTSACCQGVVLLLCKTASCVLSLTLEVLTGLCHSQVRQLAAVGRARTCSRAGSLLWHAHRLVVPVLLSHDTPTSCLSHDTPGSTRHACLDVCARRHTYTAMASLDYAWGRPGTAADASVCVRASFVLF